MTREALLQMGIGTRGTFYGTFADEWRLRTIDREGRQRKMFLMKHVLNNFGREVCDHLWVWNATSFEQLGLCKGDVVRFRATVAKYRKRVRSEADIRGVVYTTEDFKLSFPTNAEKVPDPKRPLADAGQLMLESFVA